MYGFLTKNLNPSRSWDSVKFNEDGDIIKDNWEERSKLVWNYMLSQDYNNLYGFIYKKDLSVYKIVKSNDGLTIIHCIIPSCALELRICFSKNKWQFLYLCKQHNSSSGPHSKSSIWQDDHYT